MASTSILLYLLLVVLLVENIAAVSQQSLGFQATRHVDDLGTELGPILTSQNRQFMLFMTGCKIKTMQRNAPSISSSSLEEFSSIQFRDCRGDADKSNELHLDEKGDLVVFGEERKELWRARTSSMGVQFMQLSDSGNLVLINDKDEIVWQSMEASQQHHHHHSHKLLEEGVQHWDHNFSCIFDNARKFSYLHIAYVTYFNISSKAPIYSSTDQCLDSCTNDCSCTAIVYDRSADYCYQYHDYVPVQSIAFIPVTGRDTITAYIKVQHGYDYDSAATSLSALHIITISLAAFSLWAITP